MGEYAAFRVSGSGNTISMNQFYGAGVLLDTQTVTVGYRAPSQYVIGTYGYDNLGTASGSVSDGVSDIYTGATFRSLSFLSTNGVRFTVTGVRVNSGWTSMSVNGQAYTRSSATFSTISAGAGYSTWDWPTTTNPFGTTVGATRVVTWS